MINNFDYISGKEIEWLELNLLLTKRPLSKAEIMTLSDIDDGEMIDSWLSEIEIRSKLYKEPLYEVKNNRIIPLFSWEDKPEYFLCVYYSYFGASYKSGGTKLFEKISALALKSFINGEAYIFGFPASLPFNESLDEIANICFEERMTQASGSYKDDGVDAVIYKLFEDNKSSNLYILLQSAAGNHWNTKKPISLQRWTNYIAWYASNIITSIATVDYVSKSKWDKNSSTYGMLIDRLRIYNFLYEYEIDAELRTEVVNWCKNILCYNSLKMS